MAERSGRRCSVRTACSNTARSALSPQSGPGFFGSYAYGQPTEDSDIDILVVMSFDGSSRDQAVKIRTRIDTPVAMDLLVRTPEQISELLAMDDFFIREIIEQGKVLYEANHA